MTDTPSKKKGFKLAEDTSEPETILKATDSPDAGETESPQTELTPAGVTSPAAATQSTTVTPPAAPQPATARRKSRKRSRWTGLVVLAGAAGCLALVLFQGLLPLGSRQARFDMPEQGLSADDPENVTVPPPSIFPEEDHTAIEKALDLIYNGRMDEAAAVFKKKLEDGDLSADVHIYRGAVAAHYNKLDEAESEFNRALLINPRNEIAYNDRGNLYSNRGDDKAAIADYTCAMKCGVRSVHWTNRAGVYLRMEKYDKALVDASIAAQKYPPEPLNYYFKARAEIELGRFSAALDDINQALKREKEANSYMDYRGTIYKDLADYDRAIADFDRVIATEPTDDSAYFWRGYCRAQLHQFDKARADLLRSQELDPKDSSPGRWLNRLPDMQYDYEHKPTSLAKQWAIASSDMMFRFNDRGIYSLPGEAPTVANIARQKRSLREWWGVNSRESLLSTLADLKGDGHNVLWRQYIEGKVPLDSPNSIARAQLVKKYGPAFGDRGILAWDLGRYICLCRWGYSVGYLTEDEAYKLIMPVAKELQKTYKSWKQMGEEYLVGREFWNKKEYDEDVVDYLKVTNFLNSSKLSPWVYLPWNTKLQ